ncbi:MAG TPA: hypothetical protein VM576_09790 [Xanthomonadaceae bacterium]|nr:hypothetical protein [Xanthomonadaceae bacterium]
MNDSREPLTPEEAALARRLARLGPHGEPSPALDARVLAAARAATEARPPRRPRWPAALGLAASVVLAVGIAWQLRPEPGPRVQAPPAQTPAARVMRSEPRPAATMRPEAAAAADATAASAATEHAAAPASPTEPVPAARQRAAPAVAKPASTPPPSPEPPVVFDEPVPLAAPLPPPPPAPAAPAPQAKQAAAAPVPALPPPPAPRQEAATGRTAPQREQAFDAAVAADRAADEPDADVPPATADAPAVRAAWLQRIRELVADGELDAARASLREFVRRHPDQALPDDLRPLLR